MYSLTLARSRHTRRLPSREIRRRNPMQARLCFVACVWRSASAWHNSPSWLGVLNQSRMKILVPRCHSHKCQKSQEWRRHGGLRIAQQSRRMGDRRLCLIAPRRCLAVAERKCTVRASRTGGEKLTFASSRCASQGRPVRPRKDTTTRHEKGHRGSSPGGRVAVVLRCRCRIPLGTQQPEFRALTTYQALI